MLLQSDLGSAAEVTALLWTFNPDIVVVDPEVALDVSHCLTAVAAELAAEWLLCGVSVLDVTGQRGGGGAAHVAVGALVMIHVAPHVVPQVTLDSKLLLAGDAGEGVSLLLLQAVIHELDSVSKQPATGWAANKPLLAVTSKMFLEFRDGSVPPLTARPATDDVMALQILRVALSWAM